MGLSLRDKEHTDLHGQAVVRRPQSGGGSATTPGGKEEMASQRAEHAGAIAAILLIHIIHQVTGAKFSTTIWIDNAEVIRRATEDSRNRQ